ncbi:PE family protein [Mycobacterium haemophilum]|nr:PE family protein [Mycobacterium haemophilum]MCV7340855.1 PE family protein [Mycobacterium haemophilum DSM 44634]
MTSPNQNIIEITEVEDEDIHPSYNQEYFDQSSENWDPSLSQLNASYLANANAMQANPDSMTEVSAKMVEIAHQISIANAQKTPVMTKIPAPGKDSVSALLARFFNARGDLYRVHTDRGADIGKQLSWSLKDAATAYRETDKIMSDFHIV